MNGNCSGTTKKTKFSKILGWTSGSLEGVEEKLKGLSTKVEVLTERLNGVMGPVTSGQGEGNAKGEPGKIQDANSPVVDKLFEIINAVEGHGQIITAIEYRIDQILERLEI